MDVREGGRRWWENYNKINNGVTYLFCTNNSELEKIDWYCCTRTLLHVHQLPKLAFILTLP